MWILKKVINKNILIKQSVSYGIIGCFCASLDFECFYFLRKINIDIYISNLISINTGILMSFILNRLITFRQKDNIISRAIKFFLIGYFGILVSFFIMYIGKKYTYISEVKIKILSIFIIAILQFIFNKIITFKKI